MLEGYYLENKDKLLRDFDSNTRVVRHVLEDKRCYPTEVIDAIIHEARREYEILIPQTPYIGGTQNPLTWNLVMSMQYLALYKVMKARGETIEMIGALVQETFDYWLKRVPRFLLRLQGMWQSTGFYFKRNLQKRAEYSQQRQYTGDWVFNAVKGDGKNFVYGVDYTQCGICKLYMQHDAAELLPYLCKLDYALTRAMGLELVRTQTIGSGGLKCDFRLRKAHANRQT